MTFPVASDGLSAVISSLGLTAFEFRKQSGISLSTFSRVRNGKAGLRAVRTVAAALVALEQEYNRKHRIKTTVYLGVKTVRNHSRYAFYPSGIERPAETIELLPDGDLFWADIVSSVGPLPVPYWQLFRRQRTVSDAPFYGEPLAVFINPFDYGRKQIDDRELYVIERERPPMSQFGGHDTHDEHVARFCEHDRVCRFWRARGMVTHLHGKWTFLKSLEDVIAELHAS